MMNFDTFTSINCYEADENQSAEAIYKKRKKIIDKKREKIKKRFTTFINSPSIYPI